MKRFFFTALVAIVAVGGAYAQYTTISGGSSQFNCSGNIQPLCRASAPIYFANTNSLVISNFILDKTRVNN